ncbi:MAG: TAT-variant-translocated molybdopterin oxidoreductase [Sphingobacteriales bacterium]|nr:TAT-variant-translocated molybdopterin oxidoreductase [Sphingobacteriales bacterium]
MKQPKYWRSFDELEASEAFNKKKQDEFLEELPLLSEIQDLAKNTRAPRRDFLKMLGFSLTAAVAAAGCEIPVRKAIPYVIKPEEITPGIANFYASTFFDGSDYCSVLVKTREGRPIKIEGNPLSSVTQGGTNARAQASILSLYDMARLRAPKVKGADVDWKTIDTNIKTALAGANGDIVLLTATIASPSTQQVINDFKAKYPRTRVVTYEAISQAAILYANEKSFGKKAIPAYHFDKAEVIVGVGCDFLGTWLSPVQFAADYIKNRKVGKDKTQMSRHFQFEANMTPTGAKADYRSSVKPSQLGLVLAALYSEISGGGAAGNLPEQALANIKKAAANLKAAAGKSLVVCGVNDTNAQILCNAINAALGNYGTTINWGKTNNLHQADDKAVAELVAAMNAGSVSVLMLNGVNPAYDYFDTAAFTAAMKKVPTVISFNDREDESAEFAAYLTPSNHYLESWNDAEPLSGHYSLSQPCIAPLFSTRQMQESLMAWADIPGSYYDYLSNRWKSILGGEEAWQKFVHDGVHETAGGEAQGASFGGDAGAAIAALTAKAGKSSGMEIVLYEKVAMGNGKYANNPFLQEMPDPISRVTWDNYAFVPKKTAADNSWVETWNKNGTDVVKFETGGKAIELPVTIQPGQLDGVVSVALGYGRTKPGHEKCAVGKNAYPLVSFNGETFDYYVSNVATSKVDDGYQLAQTQTHHTIDDSREIINETTFAEYSKDNWSGNFNTQQKKLDPHFAEHHYFSLYPERDYSQGSHWALVADLNACIGCGACIVACNLENNVPVVGKREVWRAHEMHWMRIDRYYKFDKEKDPYAENPSVAFQPMMCQHCTYAPCENVCPVNATNHSTEGLNQMAYNRCIGTRYCANNCPYKVRRFNWFDFQGADSFYKDSILSNDENMVMVDDLSRLVLNPDVTVRSRGVMEKCSFCVQNLQAAKLEAKKEGRTLRDGDAKTACQTSCPTQAITFGDENIKDSQIRKTRDDERSYTLLDAVQLLPQVSYQTMVRNQDEPMYPGRKPYTPPKHHEPAHGGDGHGGHDAHGGGHPEATHTAPAAEHGTAADTTSHSGH